MHAYPPQEWYGKHEFGKSVQLPGDEKDAFRTHLGRIGSYRYLFTHYIVFGTLISLIELGGTLIEFVNLSSCMI